MKRVNGERLSPFEAACWHLERTAQPLHAGSLYLLEGPLDFERTLGMVEHCLAAMPRWGARVLPVPLELASPIWVPARHFDIRQHVIRHVLRAPADDTRLERLASRILAQPLDRRRPLWEVHQIDGYRQDRSALLVKVHHCLLGGVHGSALEQQLFEVSPRSRSADPAPPGGGSSPPGELHGGALRRVAEAALDAVTATLGGVRSAVTDPLGAAGRAREHALAAADLLHMIATGAPPSPLNGHVSTLRRVAWTRLPLAEVKAVKARLGGKTADVVLTVVAGALRGWLESQGQTVDRLELRALCPTAVRDARGTRLSIVVMPLPVGILDPVERLRQVRAAREHLEREEAPRRTARALALLASAPQPLQRPLGWLELQTLRVNTICTTAPAAPVRLYLQGQRVETVVPLVPLAQGVGLAFGVLAYTDHIVIGATYDPALLRAADGIVSRMPETLGVLRELAEHSREPGRRASTPSPAGSRNPVPPRVA